jgi:hypothetical protein
MLRILRAFAWMRWRIFMNSLEKTGARDAVERFSLAVENITPIIVALVTIPSAVLLAGVGAFAGYQLGSEGDLTIGFQILRYLLLVATGLTIVGPIVFPANDRTNPVRFLLLPIPAGTLYVAQASAAIADPWIALSMPPLFFVPVGALAAGAPFTAGIALVAAVLFTLILIGLSALVTTVIHLLLRDRRRGELVALIFIIILPLISVIPASFDRGTRRERRRAAAQEATGEKPRPGGPPAWIVSGGRRVFASTPSEMYTASLRRDPESGRRSSWPLLLLAAVMAGVHAIGLVLFRRVLSVSGTSGPKRVASTRATRAPVLPGVSPATSAVAFGLWRLALRTPRGRSVLLAPFLMLGIFGFLVFRSGSFNFGPFGSGGGLGLATFVTVVGLISILPIAMNQFAVDGAGLTLMLLSPLSTRQLLAGKAIGGALIILPPTLLAVTIAGLVFGMTPFALWISLPIAAVATYLCASPVAAIFSAIFPRVVDMNSIGRGSNAHGLAGLFGMLAFAASAVPSIAIVFITRGVLHRPSLTPVILLIWCAIAFAIARLLLIPAGKIFDRRKENLSLLM